ncbi:MAG: hypothetical protein Q8O46_01525 [bacterium]|nr:hypothetical protein [bacterium]
MYKVKSIKCGKQGCKKCPHPGYLYRFFKENGKTKAEYLGRIENIDFDELLKTEEVRINFKYGSVRVTTEKRKAMEKIRLEIEDIKKLANTSRNS